MGIRRTPGDELDSRYGILAPNDGQVFTGDGYSAPGDGGSGSGGSVIDPPVPVTPPIPGATDPPATMPSYFSGLAGRALWMKVDTPAPGQDFQYIHEYELAATVTACYFRLTTAAAVGNRIMRLSARDQSDNRIFGLFANVNQAASIVREWTFNKDFPLGSGTHQWSGTLGLIVSYLSPVILLTNYIFRSDVSSDGSLRAGDQFTNVSLLLRFDARP